MKIHVDAIWNSSHVIDTADFPDIDPERVDWTSLGEWPEEALDQINASTAELVDWGVEVRDS